MHATLEIICPPRFVEAERAFDHRVRIRPGARMQGARQRQADHKKPRYVACSSRPSPRSISRHLGFPVFSAQAASTAGFSDQVLECSRGDVPLFLHVRASVYESRANGKDKTTKEGVRLCPNPLATGCLRFIPPDLTNGDA